MRMWKGEQRQVLPGAELLRCCLAAATIALSIASMAGLARADAPIDKGVCIAAAERGQELRNAARVRDARAQFALCARPECPASVAKECARWRAEADATLASVKLEAVDAHGKPVAGVKVTIDGAVWSDEVPTDAVLLDPGTHEIRFEHAGEPPVVRTLTLTMGDRERVVRATLGAPPSAPVPAKPDPVIAAPPAESGSSLVLPVALGSVGIAAVGTAATFWLLGNGDLEDSRARCLRGCIDSETDTARTKHLVGDVALAVGVIALGAAAYFFFTREKPRVASILTMGRF